MFKSNQLVSHSTNSNSSCGSFMTNGGLLTHGAASHFIEKCVYCLNPLANVAIRCAECPNLILCLKCFSMSAEIGDHKKDHNYFLKTSTHFPVFDSEKCWSYKEELLLLQFIEQYGFGNWDDIAKHLQTKSAQECMEHYHSYYIHGNLGKNTFNHSTNKTASTNKSNSSSNNHSSQAVDQSCDSLSTLSIHNRAGKGSGLNGYVSNNGTSKPSPSTSTTNGLQTTVQLPPIEMSVEEQRALGYMPLRDDFEREHKNYAEAMLSALSVTNNQVVFMSKDHHHNHNHHGGVEPNEDLVDYELKLTLIKMYREVLIERQRMKKIAREYGLINNASALINNYNNSLINPNGQVTAKIAAKEPGKKKRGHHNAANRKDPSEIINEKYKKYAQFMSVSNYENLIENLSKLNKLSDRLHELNYYRCNAGLTKFDEIERFRQEKLERQEKLSMRKKRGPRCNSKRHLMLTASAANTPKRLTRNASYLRRSSSSSRNASASKSSKRFKLDPAPKKRGKFDDDDEGESQEEEDDDEDEEDDEESEENDDEENTSEENDMVTDDLEESDQDEVNADEDEEDEDDEEEEEEDAESSVSNDLYQEGTDQEEEEVDEEEEEDENGEDEDNEEESDEETEEEDEEDEEDLEDDDKASNSMMSRLRRLTSRSWSVSSDNNKGSTASLSSTNKKTQKKSVNKKLVNGTGNLHRSINDNGKATRKKGKNGLNSRNGRTERLCSMPGYNLLSENEKKNSVAHRKAIAAQNPHNQTASINVNTSTATSSSTPPCHSPNAASINYQPQKIMTLRRSSASATSSDAATIQEPTNGQTTSHSAVSSSSTSHHHHSNPSTSSATTATNSTSQDQTANGVSGKVYNKMIMDMLQASFPDYFKIPRSTRKRILRFLCDNGWIDVA